MAQALTPYDRSAGAAAPNGSSGAGSDSERTLGRLFADATRDLSTLVRDEVALAKTELRDDVKAAARGGGMFAGAAVLGLLAIVMLSFALAYALFGLGLPRGWSFLIVGLLYVLVAGALAFIGLRQVKKVKAPERTIETTKETVAVLKGGSSATR